MICVASNHIHTIKASKWLHRKEHELKNLEKIKNMSTIYNLLIFGKNLIIIFVPYNIEQKSKNAGPVVSSTAQVICYFALSMIIPPL